MSSRASTTDLLRRTALRMFADQGFDAVPVTAIAKAAGVSHMTFFRHFPTKEAVVVNDLFDPLIAAAVRAQPRQWRPLTRAVRGLVAAISEEPAREEMSSRGFYGSGDRARHRRGARRSGRRRRGGAGRGRSRHGCGEQPPARLGRREQRARRRSNRYGHQHRR